MQVDTEGPCRSSLTFAPSQEPAEPICFDRLQRVREPVSRSKGACKGRLLTSSMGDHVMPNH